MSQDIERDRLAAEEARFKALVARNYREWVRQIREQEVKDAARPRTYHSDALGAVTIPEE